MKKQISYEEKLNYESDANAGSIEKKRLQEAKAAKYRDRSRRKAEQLSQLVDPEENIGN